MSDQSLRDALENLCARRNRTVALTEVERILDAHPAEPARPIAARDALARVLDPDIFDETKKRSKMAAAVIQIAARQHMAYEGADRMLAAGVFREPPTRTDLIWAMCRADRKEPEGKSADWLQLAEETFGRYADAVLALMGGAE